MPHSHVWGCGFLKKQQTIFIYNRRGKPMTKYDNFIKYIDDNNYAIIKKDQLNVIDITENQNVFTKFEIMEKNKCTYTITQNEHEEDVYNIKRGIRTLFTMHVGDATEQTIQQICDLINQDQQTKNIQQNKAKQI